ncbi:MAG: hypothetical protein OMM_01806 [Candidatus Magnetoglobus multicellularis str. Araruama]|uniref:tRNA-guanine(15) transglycosylase-like domain-containing protein n=1 Tax=Candidatus Magnetoglobus multicellularis str. Araruama TaxID=890399 RepID=A0A1V1PBZ6_9BACT|nr:MAG: hypothetical protein OMM_01806 [Candidatus Magnetoglobus multicellularis str. Araruama]
MPVLKNRKQKKYSLPIFLPVYHPVESPFPVDKWVQEFTVEGCIVNAFFLYKERTVRKQLEQAQNLHQYVGFPELVMTDSGAFQGFQGSLYLKNKTIVKFQETIGSDIVSPLDLVCGPGESRRIAEKNGTEHSFVLKKPQTWYKTPHWRVYNRAENFMICAKKHRRTDAIKC